MSQRTRFLVVDDDRGLRRAMSRMFQSRVPTGMTVEVAESAQQALTIVREGSADRWFIVTDLQMPHDEGDEVRDGAEFIRSVRRYDPPIDAFIVLTSAAWSEEKGKSLLEAIGADAYIAKPGDTSRFLEILKAFLARPA